MAAPGGEIKLSLFQGVAGGDPAAEVPVLVKVDPPNPGEDAGRMPSDICVVIDVSGSMGAEATIQSAGGAQESHGLSLLDIAKHGVKTVLKTLLPQDRLSVVWFNHTSEVLFGLTTMDEAGSVSAMEKLEGLQEGGGTNIWQGLVKALDVLRTGPETGRLGHIMLLTDGQTSERDSVMPNLKAYKDQYENLPGTVSTFGFGYNIDSELLCQIASQGAATYSFIPDAGFVGTIFVNTMSNLLVTMGKEAYLSIDAEDGCEIVSVDGINTVSKSGDGVSVSLGTMQFGQPRGVVVRVKPGAAGVTLFGVLRYEDANGNKVETAPAECNKDQPPDSSPELVEAHRLRSLFASTLEQAVDKAKSRTDPGLQEAQRLVKAMSEAIGTSVAKDSDFVKALLEDVEGQSSEAVSKSEYYWRWGCHYLPSIMFAHKVQQRNNFKDPSVQLYGGTAFEAIQEKADDIFNSLPAPKPSRSYRMTTSSSTPAPAAPTSMSAYNDRYGVCIDATSLVQLSTGEMCPVGRLAKGDRVAGPDGSVAEVQCVVRTTCAEERAWLVQLSDGARVTPYHPVCIGGKWRFPVDLVEVEQFHCQAVCSLVLRGAVGVLLQGGVAAASLGHGLTEDVAAHAYFGTERVLEDLSRAKGFEAGLIELRSEQVLRDEETGLVCGFRL